jgi:choice-of-anchor A domain-containing protein
MRNKLSLACAIAALAAGPAMAAGNPAAGLIDLRELNLTVLGTLTTNGQEVEGKTFAGTVHASNWTNFGIGSSAHPSQGATGSQFDILDVVNDASGSWRLKSGSPNGNNGTVGDTARIGGSIQDFDFNGTPGNLFVGGNLNNHINVNSNSVTYGGANPGGSSPATHDATLAAGGANDLHAALSIRLADLTADLTALSDALSGLTSLGTITSLNSPLDYSGATNGYAVFTMTEAAFEQQNGNFDALFSGVPAGMTTIVNVLGTDLVEGGGANNNYVGGNQSVIWNFHDATSLSLKGFHGSVLAVNADVTNSSAIEGSIVAKNFTLNGEVHLGTFAGTGNFLAPPAGGVPEPASWAMMLVGFGAIGSALRRPSVAARLA